MTKSARQAVALYLFVSIAWVSCGALPSLLSARERIRIVGSSTVYPYATYVAEELAATTSYPSPLIESTGSGAGVQLFCAGVGPDTPDIVNASRRMTAAEFATCQARGVAEMIELRFGRDGIVVAHQQGPQHWALRDLDLALALAASVPQAQNWISNPYRYWDEIEPGLPHQPIRLHGPPSTSGTRDVLITFVRTTLAAHAPIALPAALDIRNDGAYLPTGENDNLTVIKLGYDPLAFGFFGLSYLTENRDRLSAVRLNGMAPTAEHIASGAYPLWRYLYLYVKAAHRETIPGLLAYIQLFVSERMLGEAGQLVTKGLVPLPCEARCRLRQRVEAGTLLTPAELGAP